MSSGKVTRFQNNVRVDGDLDLSNSTGNLTLSPLSSAPSSPTVGDLYYDSTLGKARVYQAAGWSGMDGTAAGSLDAAYNGGSTVTVDTAAVTLNDSIVDAGALVITSSGVVTGSSTVNVLYVNSTGAHDTTGRVSLLNLNMGAETATTPEGARITMQAETDNAIKIVKGSITLDDGGLTMSSVGNATTSGWTVTTANTSGDGFTFVIDSLTSGDGFIIDGDATANAVNYFAVQEGSANIFTIADDLITSETPIVIDSDNAEAFLVRENADAADVLTIDTTQDAGDTTFTLTGKTTTGKTVNITGVNNTGNVVEINADSVSTGNALLISVASGTMGATGAAISVIDSSNTDREVFAVRDDGSVYMYGVAEGTTVTQAVTGDVVITDGDLTLSGGEVSVTDGVTTSGSGILLTSSMTTAGAATGSAGALRIVAASATTGTVLSVIADAITSGDMLYLDNGGGTLNGGFYINCNDDNASDFTVGNYGATVITGNASGTDALTLTAGDILVTSGHIDMTVGDLTLADGSITVTDADSAATITVVNNTITTSEAMVDISSSSLSTGALAHFHASAGAHDGEVIEVISATDATGTGTGISVAMNVVTTGAAKGIHVQMDEATTTAKGISVQMDKLTTGDMLYLDCGGGTLTTGGYYINCNDDNASDFTVGDGGATVITGSAGGTAALTITAGDLVITDTDTTTITSVNGTGNIVEVVSGGAIGAGKGVLVIDAAGTFNATGSLLRLEADGVTATNTPYAMVIDCNAIDMAAISIDSDAATDSAVLVSGAGAVADNKGMIEVTNTGTVAAGGALVYVHSTAAAAGATAYGVAINCNAANLEGLWVEAGLVKFAEKLTIDSGGMTITAGDTDYADGSLSITDADNAASLTVINNTITTANSLVDVSSTSITTGALVTLNANTAAHDGEVLEIISAGDATSTPVGISVTIASPTTGAARGIEVTMVGATTTAKGVAITMDALTEGNGLYIDVGGGTLTTGYYINCNDDGAVDFSVGNYGATVITGTASGTAALTLTTGDILVSSGHIGMTVGDLTLADGSVNVTDADNVASLVVVNNTLTTANSLVDVSSTSITTGALMRLNANTAAHDGEVLEIISAGDATSTPKGISVTMSAVAASTGADAAHGIWVDCPEATSGVNGIEVRMDKVTTGDLLKLDAGGATMTGAGRYINCVDDAVDKFSVASDGATVIAGTAAATAALTLTAGDLVITDTDASTISSVDGATTLLTLDNAGGAIGSGAAVLKVDAGGVVNAAGYGILATFSGAAAAGASVIGIIPDAGSKGLYVNASGVDTGEGLYIDCDPTTLSAAYIISQGALAADKATLEVVSDVTACNADSAVVRIEQTHTTGGQNVLHLKQDDIDIPFIGFETTVGVGNAVEAIGAKALTTTHFVKVDLEGVGSLYFPIGTIA